MGTRLYVGNLPYAVTELDLRDLFGGIGTVTDAKIVTDRETGRPRGFGFVEMSTEDEARKAIEEINGRDVQGRQVAVKEAEDRRRRWRWRRGGRGGHGGGGGGYGGGGGGGGYGGGGGGAAAVAVVVAAAAGAVAGRPLAQSDPFPLQTPTLHGCSAARHPDPLPASGERRIRIST